MGLSSDGRSVRKAKVIQFINSISPERESNFSNLISKAKLISPHGFEEVVWNSNLWVITKGRLTKTVGRVPGPIDLTFAYPSILSKDEIPLPWSDLIKACFMLRFASKNQSVNNQRNFITAFSYITHFAIKKSLSISNLTPEIFSETCELIRLHYSESTAYNLYKAVGEIAAVCDGNHLCKIMLDFKFHKMKRPDGAGGIFGGRLDDPETLKSNGAKLIPGETYKILGELYQKVPKSHKYRFYVLILILMACIGRRISEITLMPMQEVKTNDEGRSYIQIFGRKRSQGDTYTPLEKVFLPTDVIEIIKPVIQELEKICSPARLAAKEMLRRNGPDLRFIERNKLPEMLYKEDLVKLGISETTINPNGWIKKNHFVSIDEKGVDYTTIEGVKAYCNKDYSTGYAERIHIDGSGKQYFLSDLLIVKFKGHSSGDKPWIATQCTHSMFTTFLRYLDDLVNRFASSQINEKFTSHHFRHTLNTLLDEGGLSDLLQTEWFGRSNPRDTKAYQHTSREKRALMVREDLKNGKAGGELAKIVVNLPVSEKDVFLKARVNAVHDVGTGICVHNFVQVPCERHLQCTAKCDDYVWAKDDKGRLEEVKRQYSLTFNTRLQALARSKLSTKKVNVNWIAHSDKKLATLKQQLLDNGVSNFDPVNYMEEKIDGNTLT